MAAKEVSKSMKVTGVVEFYGYVDNYNKDGKEYVLTIKDPVFKDVSKELIEKWYTDEKSGRVDIPDQYKKILNGEKLDKAYFRSKKPIDRFQVLKDGEVEEIKIDYSPDLTDLKISMVMFRQYIGSIAIKELPPEYRKIAYDASEFSDL